MFADDTKIWCVLKDTDDCLSLPAGSAAGSSAGIVFTHGPIFGFFAPQATRCTDQGKIWHGERKGPLLRAKFHLDRSRVGGLRPQN